MELSNIQREIVYSDAKNIIVDAGAGSGKTRVLTERVKRILESGANPKSIVVITFTNDAADELKKRLSGTPGIKKCFVGTIHSYANSILKKTGKQYDIFSEYYQTQFMEYLINKYARYCSMQDYMDFLKYDKQVAKGKLQSSEIVFKFSSSKVYHELMKLLGREYNDSYNETVITLCEKNNVLFFDDLIRLSTEYFNESNTQLEYLFVDELQDIGYLEYGFLKALDAKHNFCIGDDFQSIFAFKGGDVEIFLSLMNNDDWTSYFLSENYRTAKSILTYANAIIQKANNIIKKEVICKNENVGKLEFVAKSNLDKFLSDLDETEDWLLLTRSNKELYQIDTVLNKLNKKHYCVKRSSDGAKFNKVKDEKCIKVMTVHASKGLEAENVALYGKFPVKGTSNDSDEIKVYYVGITRSKNRCSIFI